MLLWGTWSWANLISGLLVALTVLTLLPLPHVVGGARVRPLPLLVFLGHFVVDLLVSGAEVAWQAVRPGGVHRTAIVQVQRSEEHTSELQSRQYLVCRLL